MHQIIKVLRASEKNASCLLDDGRKVKMPRSIAEMGFIADEDIKEVEKGYSVVYVHISMWKPKRVPKVPALLRDMQAFDAEKELNLLKALVRKNAVAVLDRRLSADELDDLAEEVFLHFWERNYFQGYDPEKVGYLPYLSRGVRNFLIDYKRNSKYKFEKKQISMDKPVKKEKDACSLGELIADRFVLDESAVLDMQFKALFEKFDSEVKELDLIGTGLTITYSDIFKALFLTDSYDDLVLTSGHSASTVKARKTILLTRLRPIYTAYLNG